MKVSFRGAGRACRASTLPARLFALSAIASLLATPAGAQVEGETASKTPLAAKRTAGASAANTVVSVAGGPQISVRGAEGGAISATVLSVQGPDGFAKKQLGSVKFEDVALEVGLDAKPLLEWVAAAWDGKQQPRNVTLTSADVNYKATEVREMANALLAETTVPAFAGASKEAGYFSLKLAPASIQVRNGGGQDVRSAMGPKQKTWLASNFRFELGTLPGQRVSRIESFTVRQQIVGGAVGATREAVKAPGAIEFPNLTLTISDADRREWSDWHDSFVVKGNNGDAEEKSGAIVMLMPDMKSELGRITLGNCGITRLAPVPAEGPAPIGRFTVELYCERMGLQVK